MERKRSKEYSVVFLGKVKVQVANLPSRTSSLLSPRQRACPVLKHNRVSEVFKGVLKARHFEHYGKTNYVLKWDFNLCY